MVIQKLESIIGEWFGVDLVFVDSNGRIQSDVLQKEHHFFSHFFKAQMHSAHGHHFLSQEIEKWLDYQSSMNGIDNERYLNILAVDATSKQPPLDLELG